MDIDQPQFHIFGKPHDGSSKVVTHAILLIKMNLLFEFQCICWENVALLFVDVFYPYDILITTAVMLDWWEVRHPKDNSDWN
jgi:hypothetical protein